MSRIRFRSVLHLTSIAVLFSTSALLTAWIIKSGFAASGSEKARRLAQNESRKIDGSGKAASPFVIELNAANGSGTSNVVFTATVTQQAESNRPQIPVEFEWIIPEGVEMVSGERTGSLGEFQAGQSQKLSAGFNVSNPSVNQHVHLHVFRMIDGEPHGQMAQFSTGEQTPNSQDVHTEMKSSNREPASHSTRLVE